MTPKEKAEELVRNYLLITERIEINQKGTTTFRDYNLSKNCALIAVDEILDDDVYDMSEILFIKRIEYWEEVKQEIEKQNK